MQNTPYKSLFLQFVKRLNKICTECTKTGHLPGYSTLHDPLSVARSLGNALSCKTLVAGGRGEMM